MTSFSIKSIRPLAVTAVVAVAAIFSAVQPANAHSKAHFEGEIRHLLTTIEAGRQSGAITFIEGRKLRRAVRSTYVMTERMFEDGRLTRAEHTLLGEAFDEVAAKIIAERDDGWRRLRFLPRVGR